MKSAYLAILGIAYQAAAHATFQQLWCARLPMSNNPVTNVGGADIRCNVGGARGVGAKCPVKAGGVVTVEMHQQNGDRSCNNEAIGGQHYGPVMVYLSAVPDAAKADGSSDWFKVYQNSWTSKGSDRGDDDHWGVKDMNACCGKVDVPIPADLPAGDYLLRAEVVALHTQPAQLYMTCYQLTIEGGGSGALPAGVKFPGAYKGADPGLTANIHSKLSTYVAPGPAVVAGGTTVAAGSGCSGGCQKTCTAGKGPTASLEVTELPGGAGGAGSCQVAKYQQCGGQGYTGCTTCAEGSKCDTGNQYYNQCV
ncbi:related to family 61 endoglucanase [Cephalotrichum gorgonifer]|uniref:lytic cellulose monooxygenase (C4-dehydrogenating) n=1 Tax=Cephalotrichum gorgonifer TaxID=2041049 RepID=A0AAE8N8T4_9PEZI|nr:related to family 61 endoglucanase [Cephalotrichum gorgonifer]